jgi:hypothetical protein
MLRKARKLMTVLLKSAGKCKLLIAVRFFFCAAAGRILTFAPLGPFKLILSLWFMSGVHI